MPAPGFNLSQEPLRRRKNVARGLFPRYWLAYEVGMELPEPTNGRQEAGRVPEIAAVFTRLGFIAFGGPAAHLSLMENELVDRRKWCSREHFLDAASALNFIPGPNSTELALYMGFIRGGFPGLLTAGACFITPAVLIILPIAFLYVRYGSLPEVVPVLKIVSAVIVAIIATACVRLARSSISGPFTVMIAAITLAILAAHAAHLGAVERIFSVLQPEIALLALAAALGLLRSSAARRKTLSVIAWPLLLAEPVTDGFDRRWLAMVWFFIKVGATLFGSGYVLASFLQSGLVHQYHWLTPQELVDAIAVGQFTPGPLLTTATFIGYVLGYREFAGGDFGGIVGAAMATLAIFLPSFVLVGITAPLLERLRQSTTARAMLDGMNAAVVVLIAATVVQLSKDAYLTSQARPDWLAIAIGIISLVLLLRFNLNATWLVLGGVIVGLARLAAPF